MSKNSEFNHFSRITEEWWSPNGEFKILHQITPIRIEYIIKNFTSKKINKSYILDLGCGGGLTCEPLSRLGAKVTGVDFIKKNIEIATKHAKLSNLNIEYLNQDLNNLNLDKKYDVILLLEILEHLDDWKIILKKIKNLLKPKGRIIISTINRNFMSKFFAIFMAENILNWVPKNTHTYEKLIKPKELSKYLKNNEYKIIDVTGLIYNPIGKSWKLSKGKNKINYFCTAELN